MGIQMTLIVGHHQPASETHTEAKIYMKPASLTGVLIEKTLV